MKKISILILVFLVSICSVAAASQPEEDIRAQIKDLLFDYKDAYNLRDFKAVKDLYAEDALIMSFACDSKKEVFYKEFCDNLGLCSTYWVDGGFKLRLFKITSFSVDGDRCTARVSWDYRDNRNRGAFLPTFDFVRVDGKWKISKETYGRKPAQ